QRYEYSGKEHCRHRKDYFDPHRIGDRSEPAPPAKHQDQHQAGDHRGNRKGKVHKPVHNLPAVKSITDQYPRYAESKDGVDSGRARADDQRQPQSAERGGRRDRTKELARPPRQAPPDDSHQRPRQQHAGIDEDNAYQSPFRDAAAGPSRPLRGAFPWTWLQLRIPHAEPPAGAASDPRAAAVRKRYRAAESTSRLRRAGSATLFDRTRRPPRSGCAGVYCPTRPRLSRTHPAPAQNSTEIRSSPPPTSPA